MVPFATHSSLSYIQFNLSYQKTGVLEGLYDTEHFNIEGK